MDLAFSFIVFDFLSKDEWPHSFYFSSGGTPPCSIEQNLQCAIHMFKQGDNTFKLFENSEACLEYG